MEEKRRGRKREEEKMGMMEMKMEMEMERGWEGSSWEGREGGWSSPS